VASAPLGVLLLRETRHPVLAGLAASVSFLKINMALPVMPAYTNRRRT
jgi:hypothetical protein